MKVWPIFKKEMRLYFTSPTAYVVIAVFLVLAGYFFFAIFDFFARASLQVAMNPQMGRDLSVTDNVLRPLFSNMSVILLLLMPLITMRLFAEERRSGTIELLLTYPVRDGAVLVGKFLAALALYVVMLALTLFYPAHRVLVRAARVGPRPDRLRGARALGVSLHRGRDLRVVADREPDRRRHDNLRHPPPLLGDRVDSRHRRGGRAAGSSRTYR